MKHLSWALALVCGGLVAGCTPSPEKVCNHVIEIVGKEMSKKGLDDDEKKKLVEKCVKKVEKEKEEDPEGYKCGAKCAMDAKSMEDFKGCDEKCPKSKKKKDKGGDDDDGDKKKKDKDKDDDDGDKKKKKKGDDD